MPTVVPHASRRALTCLAAAASIALAGVVAPAGLASAQSEGTVASSDALGSLDVGSLAGTIGSVGSSDFPLGSTEELPSTLPSPVDSSITTTEVRSVEQVAPRREVWTVTSASMQREIKVEVSRAPGGAPAPMLYLLDGVDSPLPSGFPTMAGTDEYFADKNVTVVAPTGGPASMWADWIDDDEVLGRNKWETFLTSELPPLLEADIPFNGKRAVAGISMGAIAAMHLAATNGDFYHAVAGISGSYSTIDELGYQTARMTVETRGGDVTNMWGPRGSAQWQAHDTISHPEGLRGKAIYLSSASGAAAPEDIPPYNGDGSAFIAGIMLEKATRIETERFAAVLDARDIAHRVDYAPTGLHSWRTFTRQLDPAWQTMAPALG